MSTINVTVNPLPNAIAGILAVCGGSTTSLSDMTPGGVWSSSNTLICSVGSTGIVTGAGAGSANITYMLNTGCYTTSTVTVTALPVAISGNSYVCQQSNDSLSDATTGGVWSSSNDLVATVDAKGNVTGKGNGIATIYYTVTNTCGANSAAARVVIDNMSAQESKAVLFPNPNNGNFQCAFNSATDCQLELNITDVTGRVVYTQALTATTGANVANINLPQNIQRPSLLTVSLGNKNVKYPVVKITVTE
jgi:hypothetical protein